MRDFEQDFKEWLKNEFYKPNEMPTSPITFFDSLPFSMQWGVCQDFFDEKGIYISDMYEEYEDDSVGLKVTITNYFGWVNDKLLTPFRTRQEARQSCFKTAKEIYENK